MGVPQGSSSTSKSEEDDIKTKEVTKVSEVVESKVDKITSDDDADQPPPKLL